MVRAACDPVFESADFGFLARVMMREDTVDAVLWEADPVRFAGRYPDSEVPGRASRSCRAPDRARQKSKRVEPPGSMPRTAVKERGVIW